MDILEQLKEAKALCDSGTFKPLGGVFGDAIREIEGLRFALEEIQELQTLDGVKARAAEALSWYGG